MTSDVIEKVRKLLRLARGRGATEAEAALAAEKAQELLEKLGIAGAEIPDGADNPVDEEIVRELFDGPSEGWRSVLLNAVATTTGCKPIRVKREVFIYGTAADIQAVKELFRWLVCQVDRLAAAWLKSGESRGGLSARKAGAAYRFACAVRISKRLFEAHRARRDAVAADERAVAVLDRYRRAYNRLREDFPVTHQSSVRICRGSAAAEAGWRDGGLVSTCGRAIPGQLRIAYHS